MATYEPNRGMSGPRYPASRQRCGAAWKFDDAQAKAWIYVNVEDVQHNHTKGLATSQAMWETLRKVHGAQGQGRLNLPKRKFSKYKARAAATIDEISSELSRLQLIIRDIRETESPTDLGVALTLINSVDNEAYTMARHHLEDMRELTLSPTRERLKLVEQKIRDETTQNEETANKAQGNAKGGRLCFHCDKPGHIKVKCYKWLATNEGNEFTRDNSPVDEDEKSDDEAKQANQGNQTRRGRSTRNPTRRSGMHVLPEKTAKTITKPRGWLEK